MRTPFIQIIQYAKVRELRKECSVMMMSLDLNVQSGVQLIPKVWPYVCQTSVVVSHTGLDRQPQRKARLLYIKRQTLFTERAFT